MRYSEKISREFDITKLKEKDFHDGITNKSSLDYLQGICVAYRHVLDYFSDIVPDIDET